MTDNQLMNQLTQTITRIEVIGREWFDKINGNSYCSARVYVNDELAVTVPFQYGYDNAYVQYAAEALHEAGIIVLERNSFGGLGVLWQYCRDRNIELWSNKWEALKHEVKAWGETDES